MVGSRDHAFFGNQVEAVDHQDVGEVGDARHGTRCETRAVQFDDGYEVSPKIVFGFASWRVEAADRMERKLGHCRLGSLGKEIFEAFVSDV
jgi:hypothetical protein